MHELACYQCKEALSAFHCKDCFGTMELYCQDCIKWNSTFFKEISLKSLDPHVQLGHPPREHCIKPMAVSVVDNFVIIESNGIHNIGLDFCGCETAQSCIKQLLSSTYEFYHTLKCHSDNTGLSEPKDCYEAFMQMIHECRVHNPDGPENTQPGDCVVMCPTCPHPGINLLVNWETVGALLSWLYTLFLTIDANFHLKYKNVLNNEVDSGVGSGWGYFVDETDYKSYVSAQLNDIQEKITCLGHTTVNMADTKVSHGLAEMGIGTVDCSRHGFKLPHGVRDLQKGERYLNMDYMFFSVLQHHPVKFFFVSYDIPCQWSKKLWTQMLNMLPALQFDGQGKAMEFGVPKFHLPAHKEPCQMLYSLNFLPVVG
ncbi:hypothetical protein PAXRUDRAFT_31606 [Paxillus rubicundulus Ve08.2h10]|uniref:CxC2-like cysteine cluster KDZ transposase-associated domain-containing protein n=1 Tax=Paxillus rubicundulus Ve08.2h10 TaxID=930991 RepID=A0A0D0E1J8_9AGAM|nr:hypothetical protein PAXRUDRAFT_31606 [Paxillus rubicundulus Ve08.2h10]